MIEIDVQAKFTVLVICLAFIWIIETLVPLSASTVRQRIAHDSRNLALALLSTLVGAVLSAVTLASVFLWVEARQWGLYQWLDLPSLPSLLITLLLFDAWQYLWHVINHKVPLLWRFHVIHHADTEMDASTGLRFHFGEIAFSTLFRTLVVAVLGMQVEHLLLYEMIALPVILFHHSNTQLPASVDRVLKLLIVTPAMHRVHHSNRQTETDSNYASVLSVWDRIFGSYRAREDSAAIELGIKGEICDTLGRMITRPFDCSKSVRR